MGAKPKKKITPPKKKIAPPKKKGGRKKFYETPEQMQKIIDIYFKKCKENKEIPGMCGLAIALGMDRGTLLDYRDRDEFHATVKEARSRIEEVWERRLFTNGCTGAIFWLKNNGAGGGWKDNQDIKSQISGPDGGPVRLEWTVRFKDVERIIPEDADRHGASEKDQAAT